MDVDEHRCPLGHLDGLSQRRSSLLCRKCLRVNFLKRREVIALSFKYEFYLKEIMGALKKIPSRRLTSTVSGHVLLNRLSVFSCMCPFFLGGTVFADLQSQKMGH